MKRGGLPLVGLERCVLISIVATTLVVSACSEHVHDTGTEVNAAHGTVDFSGTDAGGHAFTLTGPALTLSAR